MGDQLAKGWADKRAKDNDYSPFDFDHLRLEAQYFAAAGAPSLNPTEAEVQAEEDMLP